MLNTAVLFHEQPCAHRPLAIEVALSPIGIAVATASERSIATSTIMKVSGITTTAKSLTF
jgi:hypothetical protein